VDSFNLGANDGFTLVFDRNSRSQDMELKDKSNVHSTVAATQNYPLVLTLTGNDQIKPSENYKTFTLNIRR